MKIWIRQLEELPPVNAMALPPVLAYLMPYTLARFSAALKTANSFEASGDSSDWPPGCLCGQNPFHAYYVTGAWALEQVLLDLGGPPAWWRLRRGILERWRDMAVEEVSGFCALCRYEMRNEGKACPHSRRDAKDTTVFFSELIDLDQRIQPSRFSKGSVMGGIDVAVERPSAASRSRKKP